MYQNLNPLLSSEYSRHPSYATRSSRLCLNDCMNSNILKANRLVFQNMLMPPTSPLPPDPAPPGIDQPITERLEPLPSIPYDERIPFIQSELSFHIPPVHQLPDLLLRQHRGLHPLRREDDLHLLPPSRESAYSVIIGTSSFSPSNLPTILASLRTSLASSLLERTSSGTPSPNSSFTSGSDSILNS